MTTAYQTLKVSSNASQAEIENSIAHWRRLHNEFRQIDAEFLAGIEQAYEQINTPEKRAAYDAALKANEKKEAFENPSFALVTGKSVVPGQKLKVILICDDHNKIQAFKDAAQLSSGTIGIDSTTLTDNTTNVEYQVWDMAGQQRFREISSAAVRGVHVALFFQSHNTDERMTQISNVMTKGDDVAPKIVSLAYVKSDPMELLRTAGSRIKREAEAVAVSTAALAAPAQEKKSSFLDFFRSKPAEPAASVAVSAPYNFRSVNSGLYANEVTPGAEEVTPGAPIAPVEAPPPSFEEIMAMEAAAKKSSSAEASTSENPVVFPHAPDHEPAEEEVVSEKRVALHS